MADLHNYFLVDRHLTQMPFFQENLQPAVQLPVNFIISFTTFTSITQMPLPFRRWSSTPASTSTGKALSSAYNAMSDPAMFGNFQLPTVPPVGWEICTGLLPVSLVRRRPHT